MSRSANSAKLPPHEGPAENALDQAMEALAQRVLPRTGQCGEWASPIPNLSFHRFERPTNPTGYLLEPSICMILQGSKRVFLGQRDFTYGSSCFFVVAVDLPVIAQVLEAHPSTPYLGLVLKLDRAELARLVIESPSVPQPSALAGGAMDLSEIPLNLLKAVSRLIDLLDEPEVIPVLAPLIQREILYRLLLTPSGPRIRQIAVGGSPTQQISQLIVWIKSNLRERIRIEQLAKQAGMSVSSLHHHFRALTSLSPLQYQKRLRLNQARWLMLEHRLDVASAAFQVGYESPSQFSREYRRLFGVPPLRNIKTLIGATILEQQALRSSL